MKVEGFTWTGADENLIAYNAVWGDVLVDCGRADERIVAVCADLAGSTLIGRFRDAFPERYIAVGVAEQNLVAVAAGLAAAGLVPVISTYAVFASLRAAEFVRTDLAYNRRNAKIIATLAGVSFGQGGPTHHALEDLALMRAIPGLVVLAPADGPAAGAALRAALAHDGPVYLRLGRSMEPRVYGDAVDLTIGRAVALRDGGDVTVIACGGPVVAAAAAADRAARDGIAVRVLDMHTIKPLDEEAVRRALADTRRIVTVEDHSVIGGLGGAVAEVIAASGKGCAVRRLGHADRYAGMGIPEDLAHQAGIDEDGILAAIAELMRVSITTDDDWEDG